MVRAIFIFLVAALIAAFVVWVVSYPGWVTADWFGYRYEAPMSLTVLILVGLFAALYFALRLVSGIAGGPAAWQRYFRRRRARRGMGALTEGLAAAAAGDAHLAHRQAARAGRLVKDGPLAQVLALEAALLEERYDDVGSLAPVLLDHPETELLGRRALFDLARKRNRQTEQVDHAEAAFGAHPAAGWAAEALLADAVRAGHWDRARSILNRALRHDAFTKGHGEKVRGALLLAEATAQDAAGEKGKAASLARKAREADPGLVAAAVMRAEQLAAAGKPRAARDITLKLWDRYPHPVLGRLFAESEADEAQSDRLNRVRELVAVNPDHVESRLLVAEQAIAARDIAAARQALAPLVGKGGSARAFALMAALERAELGAAASPENWIERALAAPRDAVWICGDCGHRESSWHAVCPRCGAVASLEWATHEQGLGPAAAETAAAPEVQANVAGAPSALAQATAKAAAAPAPAAPQREDAPPPANGRQPDDPGTDKKAPKDEEREW